MVCWETERKRETEEKIEGGEKPRDGLHPTVVHRRRELSESRERENDGRDARVGGDGAGLNRDWQRESICEMQVDTRSTTLVTRLVLGNQNEGGLGSSETIRRLPV